MGLRHQFIPVDDATTALAVLLLALPLDVALKLAASVVSEAAGVALVDGMLEDAFEGLGCCDEDDGKSSSSLLACSFLMWSGMRREAKAGSMLSSCSVKLKSGGREHPLGSFVFGSRSSSKNL